jgi:hypothetical protein
MRGALRCARDTRPFRAARIPDFAALHLGNEADICRSDAIEAIVSRCGAKGTGSGQSAAVDRAMIDRA